MKFVTIAAVIVLVLFAFAMGMNVDTMTTARSCEVDGRIEVDGAWFTCHPEVKTLATK